MSEPAETWNPIPGFPGYEVSDYGRVRSPDVRKRGYFKRGRILKPSPRYHHRSGRLVCMVVNLCVDGHVRMARVHRLVLTAFVGPAPTGTEGCHNDGDPSNNRLGNLRWDTHLENYHDMRRHGTATRPPRLVGESHPNTNLTERDVAAIRHEPARFGVNTTLGRRYGVSHQTIRRIRARETWAHVA